MKSMKIGEVAKLAGTGIETIRFYEREGLLLEPERRPSGYRQYDEATVERLDYIRRAEFLGSPDVVQPFDGRLVVLPVAGGTALRLQQQTLPLVESDRLDPGSCELGDLPDLHGLHRMRPRNKQRWVYFIVWSILQSQ